MGVRQPLLCVVQPDSGSPRADEDVTEQDDDGNDDGNVRQHCVQYDTDNCSRNSPRHQHERDVEVSQRSARIL